MDYHSIGKIMADNIENLPMGVETRVTVLETNMSNILLILQEIKQEFRDLRYEQSKQFEKIDQKFERLEIKLDRLDSKLDNRFDFLNSKIETAIATVEKEVKSNYRNISDLGWSQFRWMMGMGVTCFTGSFALIAKAMNWL
jgi:hypothetical protein